MRKALVGVAVGALAIGAGFGLRALTRSGPAAAAEARVQQKKDRLLKQTDLEALRDASRLFVNKYGRSPRQQIPLDDRRLPPIVVRLEPTEVLLGETFVRVELGGEGYHYGFEVFRSHFDSAAFPTSEQIFPDLWYYENVGAIERAPP